jgi:Fe2+ transport system protein FeoA
MLPQLAPERSVPLSEAEVGQSVRILKVGDESSSVLNHLEERGLVPGRNLRIKEVRALNSIVTVQDEGAGAPFGGGFGAGDFRPGSVGG